MSERGSFVTEYIHCTDCFDAVKSVLLRTEKELCSVEIPSWCDQDIPIIAGKIGGGYHGENLMSEYISKIEVQICHIIRIVVVSDTGTHTFKVIPFNPIKN